MSEHELSTMLRDHLSDEPLVSVTAAAAIRTGRRQSRVRAAVAGGAAVVALGVATATVPGLAADDGRTTAHESPGVTGEPSGTYTDRLQTVTQDELGQYLELGTADLWVTDVDSEEVPADSPDVQGVFATYDLGDTVVVVIASGFAPEEFSKFQVECNPEGWQVSCEPGSLPDGSMLTTEVDTFQQAGPAGAMRSRSPGWVANHPDDSFFGRAVHLAAPSGLDVYVAEYVKAASLDDVQWQIPAAALQGLATDGTVLDPAGVAHAPVCQSAHTSC